MNSPESPLPLATAPLPPNLIDVPAVQQAQGYSCGAAATLVLLRFWRFDEFERVDEASLYGVLETTSAQGTEPEPMVAMFRRTGLEAEYRSGDVTVRDLECAVDSGQPPIVDLQAWSDYAGPWRDTWDAGHYVVMVGYDDERLFFFDPSRATPAGYAFLLRPELEERWHDLAGEADVRVARMAIFVRGSLPLRSSPVRLRPANATKLG